MSTKLLKDKTDTCIKCRKYLDEEDAKEKISK